MKGTSVSDLMSEVDVLKDMGTYAIARGSAAGLEALKGRGIACEVLDTDSRIQYGLLPLPARNLG